MARRKRHYKEGDWFAVPLKGGGYALGLIARMKANSVGLFGYFFGHRYVAEPMLANAVPLRPTDAFQRLMFSDLDLQNREWPVLGALPGWDRRQWPMPSFVHKDVISGRPYIRTYDEDTLRLISERRAKDEEIAGLPEDGLFGAGAVITRISSLVRQQAQSASAADV